MVIYNVTTSDFEFWNGSVWFGFRSADTLAELLTYGNTTGGTDIVVSTGDVATLTDSPVADTDAANKKYVDDNDHVYTDGPATANLWSPTEANAPTGADNVVYGVEAGTDISGNGNTAIGQRAMAATSAGANNVAVGDNAMANGAQGNNNVAVGPQAGASLTTGSANTLIGRQAGDSLTNGANNIVIGNLADLASNASNKMSIGNTIYADLSNDYFAVGTDTPIAGIQLSPTWNGGEGVLINTNGADNNTGGSVEFREADTGLFGGEFGYNASNNRAYIGVRNSSTTITESLSALRVNGYVGVLEVLPQAPLHVEIGRAHV